MRPSSQKSKAKPETSLRGRALRLLARREHTRRELERKLGLHVGEGDDLNALLDDLTVRGWISETRYAESLVNAKRGRYGPARIRQLLTQRGVSDETIASALASLKASESEAARVVWSRKFRLPPQDANERARQVRFLQSRGFSLQTAMRVVGGREDD